MKFGKIFVNKSLNGILAHSMVIEGKKLKKGKIINKTDNINAKTLTNIIMPNKIGFIDAWGPDWWREWIHQKYAIFFTSFLLLGILTITLFKYSCVGTPGLMPGIKPLCF